MRIDRESWPELLRLLDQWLDLPEGARAQWLDSLQPEHADLLPYLRRLTQNPAAMSDGFLNTLPPLQPDPAGGGFVSGDLVGPYRLIRELGQGGMGTVWLAERADGTLKRPVALKLPMVAIHNRLLAERFVREREILGSLTHPNIARLYDAGISDQQQPYLALEYIEGEKITDYCDQRKATLDDRLRLFLQVLGAVQYAHTNLIVHRDLKPANILVTGDGQARLLDFGIAKLLSDGEANETELTRIGGRALTPDYASPEQIAGGAITTTSDVYSLGVVLYELLAGERPYKLKRSTRLGLENAILTAEPERPSQTVRDDAKAKERSSTVTKLARALKGDLDTIVLKALQKEPRERYTTAEAFAEDIERYLHGEPVRARPERAWYRAGKFVKRNKVAVAAVLAIVAALGAGLTLTAWQAHIARMQTRRAETVQAFLMDIFRANSIEHSDPVRARQATARELLDLGAKKIDSALKDAPEAKLEVLETLFRLYTDLGLQDQAVPIGRSWVSTAKAVYGPDHLEVARALVELAANSGESKYANDRPALLKEAGDILDRKRDTTSRTRAIYYLAVGNVVVRNDLPKSAEYAAKGVEILQKLPPSRELVYTLNLLGQRQEMQSEYTEAIATLSRAAAVATSLQGTARRSLPAIYAVLAEAQRQVLDIEGAERSMRLAVDTARAVHGNDSVDVLQTEWRFGNFLVQTSRVRDGLALLKDAEELAVRTLGPDETFHTPMVRRGYGVNLFRTGRPEEAAVKLAQIIETARRANEETEEDFAVSLESYAPIETELGHYSHAAALLDKALGIRASLGDKGYSLQVDDARIAQAKLLVATTKVNEAARALEELPQAYSASPKMTYSWLNVSLARAEVDIAGRRAKEAIERASLVRKRVQESGLSKYFKRWDAQAALLEGKGLMLANRPLEALTQLESALQLGSDVYDPDLSPELADSQVALASCLAELGRRAQALVLLHQAQKIHAHHKELGQQYTKPLQELVRQLR